MWASSFMYWNLRDFTQLTHECQGYAWLFCVLKTNALTNVSFILVVDTSIFLLGGIDILGNMLLTGCQFVRFQHLLTWKGKETFDSSLLGSAHEVVERACLQLKQQPQFFVLMMWSSSWKMKVRMMNGRISFS